MLVRFTFEDGKQEYFPVQKVGIRQGVLLWYKEEGMARRDLDRPEFWLRRTSIKSVEVDFFFKGCQNAISVRPEMRKAKGASRVKKNG